MPKPTQSSWATISSSIESVVSYAKSSIKSAKDRATTWFYESGEVINTGNQLRLYVKDALDIKELSKLAAPAEIARKGILPIIQLIATLIDKSNSSKDNYYSQKASILLQGVSFLTGPSAYITLSVCNYFLDKFIKRIKLEEKISKESIALFKIIINILAQKGIQKVKRDDISNAYKTIEGYLPPAINNVIKTAGNALSSASDMLDAGVDKATQKLDEMINGGLKNLGFDTIAPICQIEANKNAAEEKYNSAVEERNKEREKLEDAQGEYDQTYNNLKESQKKNEEFDNKKKQRKHDGKHARNEANKQKSKLQDALNKSQSAFDKAKARLEKEKNLAQTAEEVAKEAEKAFEKARKELEDAVEKQSTLKQSIANDQFFIALDRQPLALNGIKESLLVLRGFFSSWNNSDIRLENMEKDIKEIKKTVEVVLKLHVPPVPFHEIDEDEKSQFTPSDELTHLSPNP